MPGMVQSIERAAAMLRLLASSPGRLGIVAILEGKVLVVPHVSRPDDTLQTLDVGALLPLHGSALGKVLLAYAGTAARTAMQAVPEQYTRRTLTEPKELARALLAVREA